MSNEIPSNLTQLSEIEAYLFEKARAEAQKVAQVRQKDAILAQLHTKIGPEIGIELSSTDALIKQLAKFASKSMQTKVLGSSEAPSAKGTRKQRIKVTEEIKAEAKKIFDETGSISKVAKAIGCSYATAKNICK